ALVAVVARAVERVGHDVAVAGDGAGVAGHVVGEGEFGGGGHARRLYLRVAVDEGHFADAGVVAGVRGGRDALRGGGAGGAGAGGVVLVGELGGHVQAAAAVAVGDAGVAGELAALAVAGRVLAEVDGQAAAGLGALEHDVDHAGDRVRAVLGRGAVAQHFDARDRRD